MSQVNMPDGPTYRDEGPGMGMAGMVAIIVVIVIAAVLVWGALAGNWFGTTTSPGGIGTSTTTSQPARPATSAPAAAPGGGTGY
jgi:hypothetical protein